MTKYRNISELEKCNNYELIAYNRFLKTEPSRIKQEVKELNQCWDDLQKLLRTRIQDLEYGMLEIEDIRLSNNVLYDEIYLDLQ